MISPFQGEPKPLEKPITPEEVRKSFNSLNNNKAPGRHRDIPANKATRAYFFQCGKNHRGRPRTTLPTVLNRDLALIDHEIRLHLSDELDKITALAQDRRQWHEMTVKMSCRSVADRELGCATALSK
ncbi:hypothetical protein ElyMa_000289100 [Elysia marginata]|uniref:Uncharacterized protein n=1 Tax=Elysia marginata TaxID=1093978 RepID=A0AAV4F7T7_9GAST|nr:hypothetical protein ElyMa_000289100 [Elysia marginata]